MATCIERMVAPLSFSSTTFIDVAVSDAHPTARHDGVASRCSFTEDIGQGRLVISSHA